MTRFAQSCVALRAPFDALALLGPGRFENLPLRLAELGAPSEHLGMCSAEGALCLHAQFRSD